MRKIEFRFIGLPLFIVFFILFLSGCKSEKSLLQSAIETVETRDSINYNPYIDPYFRERSTDEIKKYIEANDISEIISLYQRLDTIGQQLLLEQLDDDLKEQVKNVGKPRGKENQETQVTVFFGTNRKPVTGNNQLEIFEEAGFTDRLIFGKCNVNIPPLHVLGEIEKPSVYNLEFSNDPKKHMFIKSIKLTSKDNFVANLKNQDTREAFVFIHGYNTDFEEAALRTAQIAYDLNYPGTPLFYSWPSRGTLQGYFDDEKTVRASAKYLYEFLKTVEESGSFDEINIVAHSMGNRATLDAMVKFSKEYEEPPFNHLVMAAPDVDADVFKKEIAPFIGNSADDVTLYASTNDVALQVSNIVNKKPRLGQAGENILVIPGIETIDASVIPADLLGHGYFYNSWRLVQDVYNLIVNDHLADERGLGFKKMDMSKYWFLHNED